MAWSGKVNFDNPYWSNRLRMSYLQRRVIVHSILYYEMGENVISDSQFDTLSKQLVEMAAENKEEAKQTDYYYCMKDFDGSTGFDLWHRLNEQDKEKLELIAYGVLRMYRKGNGK